MSTLRVDTLQTTDSLVTRQVADLVNTTILNDAIAGIPVSTSSFAVSNTVATAKTVAYISGGIQAVQTKGYYAVGDNGAGVYVRDPSDTTSADNGGSVLVATDGSRLKLVHNRIANVRQWGARGDGSTNDTTAFTRALAWANSLTNVTVYVPPGIYPVAGNLSLTNMGTGTQNDRIKISIIGSGRASEILHTADQPLFVATGTIYDFSVQDITIRNARSSTSNTNAVFYFPAGNCNSDFTNVHYLPNVTTNVAGNSFYVCGAGQVHDSVNFHNCYIFADRIGIQLGAGSSIYINGGRIISSYPAVTTAIGINFTGGMGGVWITNTDVIGCGTAINIAQNGASTNREIFLNNTCVDSCATGLNIIDAGSFTSWTGVWAASCSAANINYAPTSDASILNLTGGTIFNAGASAAGLNDGLSLNQYGRVQVSNVHFRNNR